MVIGRWVAIFSFLSLCSVAGCSDPASKAPTSAPLADAGVAADTSQSLAEPSFTLPTIWGVRAAKDKNPAPDVVEIDLTASRASFTFQGIALQGMLAYNGQIPGPLIQAKVGDTIVVHFKNDTSEPTTVHWHGMRISDQMDGNPRIQSPVQPGESFTYRFEAKEAGSFWYHPHVNSNEQMERGLSGAIVIHDPAEPRYDLQRQLVLDDILFNPATGQLQPFLASHPQVMHGRYGNRLLTNGNPAHTVTASASEGTVERWRIVNTANARTMSLAIEGARFRVIATDGGPLGQPYTTDRLLVPVGQRYDVEVSYHQAGEAKLVLYTPALDDAGELVELPNTVFSVNVAATGQAPRVVSWPERPELVPHREPTHQAKYTLSATQDAQGQINWRINGEAHAAEPLFIFDEGDTVKIRLVNTAGPEHPFHLHGQFFRIIDAKTPWTSQPGLKDTVLVPGGSSVEIIAYMDNPGQWMAHCHILAHAKLGMMSELVVRPR